MSLVAVALLGTATLASRSDFDRDALTAERARNDWATPKSQDAVYFASTSRTNPEIVFLGDSHTEQYFPAVKQALASLSPGPTVAFSTHGGCPFLPNFRVALCGDTYRRSMGLASSASVRRVVITSAWDTYSLDGHQGEDFQLTHEQVLGFLPQLTLDILGLRQLGKDVVIIGPHPHAETADPELLAAHTRISRFGMQAPSRFAKSFPLSAFRQRTAVERAMLTQLAAQTGATLIDPASVLCPSGACLTMDEHGKPLRKDSNHLRPFAAIRYLTYVPALVTLPAPQR